MDTVKKGRDLEFEVYGVLSNMGFNAVWNFNPAKKGQCDIVFKYNGTWYIVECKNHICFVDFGGLRKQIIRQREAFRKSDIYFGGEIKNIVVATSFYSTKPAYYFRHFTVMKKLYFYKWLKDLSFTEKLHNFNRVP